MQILQHHDSDGERMRRVKYPWGGSLHSQVEHHVRDKFATHVLYGIDILLFDDIFSTYT